MQMAPVQQMGFQFGLLLEEKVHISARVTKAIWGGFFFFFFFKTHSSLQLIAKFLGMLCSARGR